MKTEIPIFAAALCLISCSSDVTLNPTVQASPDVKIGRTVGLHLTPVLRHRTYSADPYRNRHTANFPVGAASAKMFERLLTDRFAQVVPLHSHPPDAALIEPIEAVFEPAIRKFKFSTIRVGEYRYWAAVEYRINVFAPQGALLASWPIIGWGEAAGYDAPAWGRAANSALENAGRRFARSLADYPEAKWWNRTLATEATVLAPSLEEALAPEEGEYVTRAQHPGILTITANGRPDVKGAVPRGGGMNATNFLTVEISLKNERSHPLLLEKTAVRLRALGGSTWANVPPSLMAALATRRYGRVMIWGPGPVGAVMGIITGVASGTAALSEEQAYKERLASLRPQTFEDVHLAPGQTASGLVFFLPSRADRALQRMVLIASTIDPVSATRLEVRLPIALPPHVPLSAKPDNPAGN